MSSARRGRTVVYASGAELQTLNPLLTTHPLAKQVERYVLLTTLVRYDTALAPQPYLARTWTWSRDRTALVFRLQAGVRWHDGAPTTARPRLDTALSVTTVTLFALPGYWLGLMLVMVFTYWARWLPAFGAAGLDADLLTGWGRLVDRLRHLALPLTTLSLIGIGGAARFVRGAMRDVRAQPFVTAAQAKGLAPQRVLRRHVLRNSLIPIVTLLGLSLPALFSGAVFVEAVFAWPGVGRKLVEAVRARDYPVVMAATTISATLVVAGNLLADLAVAWLDPRIRHGEGDR